MASAWAATAAKKEALFPAGAKMKGREDIIALFSKETQTTTCRQTACIVSS
jgi:hypothetical protein